MTQEKRKRDKLGQFSQKSDQPREVKSIRITNITWEKMGKIAASRGITRADLLEEIFLLQPESVSKTKVEETMAEILEDSLIARGHRNKEAVKRSLESLFKKLFPYH